jgi:hypothetical protein
MKRYIPIAALAALTMFAAPAAAQYSPNNRDHRSTWQTSRAVSVTNYSPRVGTAGTAITIQGRNFVRGTRVVYDGKLITPSRLTATSLTFTIPRGSKSSSIALRLPNTRRDVTVGSFQVRVPPVVNSRVAQQRFERAFLADSKTRSELALHNGRMARLNQMLRLAIELRDSSLQARIRVAISNENNRHQRQMASLRASFRYEVAVRVTYR